MGTRDKILAFAKTRKSFVTQDLVKHLKIGRQTLSLHLSKLVEQGRLSKVGSTRSARYHAGSGKVHNPGARFELKLVKKLPGLQEDRVESEVALRGQLKNRLSEKAYRIFAYAFTEMLNNAIDHSQSKNCRIEVKELSGSLFFSIRDFGIGAFANVQRTFKLDSEFEAIEHLFKGKQTTDPSRHSGQGIFFTSRIADRFILKSHQLEVVRDNEKDDLFVKDIRSIKGTEVAFQIRNHSKKELKALFDEFSNDDFEFDKNTVHVKLSKGSLALSRSEARRLLTGLDKFERVDFNFSGVKEIGQAFADEIFRVFANRHPEIELTFSNATPAVSFLITRALRER